MSPLSTISTLKSEWLFFDSWIERTVPQTSLFGPNIFRIWVWIARLMIMDQQDRSGRRKQRSLEHFSRVDNALVAESDFLISSLSKCARRSFGIRIRKYQPNGV
jgi:hypothetical protein